MLSCRFDSRGGTRGTTSSTNVLYSWLSFRKITAWQNCCSTVNGLVDCSDFVHRNNSTVDSAVIYWWQRSRFSFPEGASTLSDFHYHYKGEGCLHTDGDESLQHTYSTPKKCDGNPMMIMNHTHTNTLAFNSAPRVIFFSKLSMVWESRESKFRDLSEILNLCFESTWDFLRFWFSGIFDFLRIILRFSEIHWDSFFLKFWFNFLEISLNFLEFSIFNFLEFSIFGHDIFLMFFCFLNFLFDKSLLHKTTTNSRSVL